MGDKANMPLKMFRRRTQIGACIEAFFVFLTLLTGTYYLPLYYQSAEEHSATRSGIDILPYMISVVTGAAGAGAIINRLGRPLPFLIGAPLLASLGSGLLFWTLTKTMNTNHIFGFQVLLGFGVGAALQNTIISIQAEYVNEPIMVPQATSLVQFLQLLGGIIGISVSGTIFGNQLSSNIAKYAPDLSPSVADAVRQSVKAIYTLQGQDKANVVKAYSDSLGHVFIIGIPAGLLASLAGCLIRNFNLKKMKVQHGGGGGA